MILNNISEDGEVGKMELEVIAEDAYFQPYEETFKVETSKKATVEVLNKKLESLDEFPGIEDVYFTAFILQ